jgi:hypothetical protein
MKEGKSFKYWHIVFIQSENYYIAIWGRIDQEAQAFKVYNEKEARKKIREKKNKRYIRNENFPTSFLDEKFLKKSA